jgi:imidazole glycerol-phosphate synthase subunit HisH
MIAVIDYGAGNLRNVCKALEHVGAELVLTEDPAVIRRADKLVLPGVGAFADCMQGLVSRGLVEPLHQFAASGRPFLGICVGMQLLFDVGEEMGEWPGLGLIPGRMVRFKFDDLASESPAQKLKVPHIGWNQVHGCQMQHPVLNQVTPDGYAYFVHSFHAVVPDARHVIAMTNYGYDFASVIARENIWGIQFHPEKSQDVGLQMLRNFVTL